MILRVFEPSVLEGDNQVTVRQVIQNFRREQILIMVINSSTNYLLRRNIQQRMNGCYSPHAMYGKHSCSIMKSEDVLNEAAQVIDDNGDN